MKSKLILNLIIFQFSYCLIQAQAPQGINYQAVLRNGVGALLQNQSVTIKFSIHQASSTGVIVYEETQATITNNFALVNLQIGQGLATIGIFSSIKWGANSYFLEVQVNIGTGYISLGTTQFVSVPYALYANTAGSSPSAAFQAHLANNFNLTGNTTTTVVFNSPDFNDGNHFNPANGTFTAPDTGFYHFDVEVIFMYPSYLSILNITNFGNYTLDLKGWSMDMWLNINGTPAALATQNAFPSNSGPVGQAEVISTNLFLLPGQSVSVSVRSADYTTYINGQLHLTQFSGFKVYSKH